MKDIKMITLLATDCEAGLLMDMTHVTLEGYWIHEVRFIFLPSFLGDFGCNLLSTIAACVFFFVLLVPWYSQDPWHLHRPLSVNLVVAEPAFVHCPIREMQRSAALSAAIVEKSIVNLPIRIGGTASPLHGIACPHPIV